MKTVRFELQEDCKFMDHYFCEGDGNDRAGEYVSAADVRALVVKIVKLVEKIRIEDYPYRIDGPYGDLEDLLKSALERIGEV